VNNVMSDGIKIKEDDRVNGPLISVVMPTYNCAKFICEAVDSVLKQTYKKIELIIVDDGSTDSTHDVLKQYFSDNRLTYIAINNSGSSNARNVGINLAKGDYICFLDSDDIWPIDKVEYQINMLAGRDSTAIVGNVQRFTVDEDGEKQLDEISYPPKVGCNYKLAVLNVHENQMVNFNTIMAPTKVMKEFGLWNPIYQTAHDWENWLRLSEKLEFVNADKVLQFYRKHSGASTLQQKHNFYIKYQLMAINEHTRFSFNEFIIRARARSLVFSNYIAAWIYHENFGEAALLWLRAICTSTYCLRMRCLENAVEIVRGTVRRWSHFKQ